jgi:hypothetical protein
MEGERNPMHPTYDVRIPVAGGSWLTLCTCDRPESAAEIVRALLSAGRQLPESILVVPSFTLCEAPPAVSQTVPMR